MEIITLDYLFFYATLVIILFTQACQPRETEPTVGLTPIIFPQPVTAFPTGTKLVVAWSVGLGGTYYIYINESGEVSRWVETPRGGKRYRTKTVTEDIMLEIEQQLQSLRDVRQPSVGYGDQAVTVLISEEPTYTFTCGNLNCPIIVRDIVSFVSDLLEGERFASPFVDEELLQEDPWSSDELARLSWRIDPTLPFQVLSIKESKLETIHLNESGEITDYQAWSIESNEFDEVMTCLEALSLHESANEPNDMQVIKFIHSFTAGSNIIRLPKTDPPECLQTIIEIAQTSLKREIQNPTLQINPIQGDIINRNRQQIRL